MPLPADVRDAAVAQLERCCQSAASEQMRIEHGVRR
jgi:hypothetical protein